MKATLAGVVRLLPRAPAVGTFVVVATAPLSLSSSAGICGTTLQIPDTAAIAGMALAAKPGSLYFRPCDGANNTPYQLDINSTGASQGSIIGVALIPGRMDFSGAPPASSLISRSGTVYVITPVVTGILAGGVVNAASFTADLAPGGYVSIFGTGLTQSGAETTVQVNGQSAPSIAASAFQVNALIPASIAPGTATLTVNAGAAGQAQTSIILKPVAPAIFSIGPALAAITNQDNSLNTPANPAARSKAIVIYSTGLGATTAAGAIRCKPRCAIR